MPTCRSANVWASFVIAAAIIVSERPAAAAPVVTAGVAASFVLAPNAAAETLDTSLSVADGGSTTLIGATVSIVSGFVSGDVLSANTTGTAINASYDSTTGVLTLSGSDTLADYQQVLESVSFLPPSGQTLTTNVTRGISWQVSDGTASNTATSSLTIAVGTPVTGFAIPSGNDALAITGGTGVDLGFTEKNAAKVGLVADGNTTGLTPGTIFEFAIPSGKFPNDIVLGPDGAFWFTEQGPLSTGAIGRLAVTGGTANVSGAITEFPLPGSDVPFGIAEDNNQQLWFTVARVDPSTGKETGYIGKITTAGVITEYAVPSGNLPLSISFAQVDGGMLFTEGTSGATGGPIPPGYIWLITANGTITEYPIPSGDLPYSATIGVGGMSQGFGADAYFPLAKNGTNAPGYIGSILGPNIKEVAIPSGNIARAITWASGVGVWFTEDNNLVGLIPASGGQIGGITEVALPNNISPFGIAEGYSNNMWFTDVGKNGGKELVSLSTIPGQFVSAMLPSSRSVQVGATATAFMTAINTGYLEANSCAISPATSVSASFSYQATDPTTNAPIGAPNNPVSIPVGGSQSFVVALTPNQPFGPTDVAFGFTCANVTANNNSYSGLNTLLLSASSTPVPDIVALSATTRNDGILHITGTTGSAAFAVATVNLGAGATITATADTGQSDLPVGITLCQTDPMSGACISAVGPSVSTVIVANATPTFGVFATASSAVSFNPAGSRIFVRFKDGSGITRGSTSVAVETQ